MFWIYFSTSSYTLESFRLLWLLCHTFECLLIISRNYSPDWYFDHLFPSLFIDSTRWYSPPPTHTRPSFPASIIPTFYKSKYYNTSFSYFLHLACSLNCWFNSNKKYLIYNASILLSRDITFVHWRALAMGNSGSSTYQFLNWVFSIYFRNMTIFSPITFLVNLFFHFRTHFDWFWFWIYNVTCLSWSISTFFFPGIFWSQYLSIHFSVVISGFISLFAWVFLFLVLYCFVFVYSPICWWSPIAEVWWCCGGQFVGETTSWNVASRSTRIGWCTTLYSWYHPSCWCQW